MSGVSSSNPPAGKPQSSSSIDTNAWVDRYGDVLYRYALFRTSEPIVAEDLVQEAFLSALKTKSTFASRSSEQTWLVGILKHKVLDYYRSKLNGMNSRIESSDDIDASFTEKGAWREQLAQWSSLPDNELSRKEFVKVLYSCLSKLPADQRNVFLLREVDGFATTEICKDRNVTSTNLWVLLHRARKKLRACLESNWFRTGEE